MSIFHILHTDIEPPKRLNNPFCYEPHPLARLAAEDVQHRLPALKEGKMFGVLVVSDADEQLGYLLAYSGQSEIFMSGRDLQGASAGQEERLTEEDFAPAVFDYLQPDGYFKVHEAEITALNRRIAELEEAADFHKAKAQLQAKAVECAARLTDFQQTMAAAKRLRDERRQLGGLSAVENDALIRESQFQKAELRRMKKLREEELSEFRRRVALFENEIGQLKATRKRLSDALQRWIFTEFQVADSHGRHRSLLSIFDESIGNLPPSGAGECCEPKLLHYAFTHALRPLTMAMFWWGESPKGEVRLHGNYYPACQGKCKPLLTWMLRDVAMDKNPLEETTPQELTLLYEDEAVAVVCKPAGMLAVPGKSARPSVQSILLERWPEVSGPIMVHRLDMDTSGLMVVAKTKEAHACLQQQFERRQTEKTYLALLEKPLSPCRGNIALPLRPDLDDRPRQVVDTKCGKPALTLYNIIGVRNGLTFVELSPKTGRTHQLRMHCAHKDGLDAPIVGDPLYGHPADRLYLHAFRLTFTHPTRNERLTFEQRPSGGLWDAIGPWPNQEEKA